MNCEGCKFWSELVASSMGCQSVKAMCLNDRSPNYQLMVSDGCDQRIAGPAVDDPFTAKEEWNASADTKTA